MAKCVYSQWNLRFNYESKEPKKVSSIHKNADFSSSQAKLISEDINTFL